MVATKSHSSRRPSGLGAAHSDRISRRRPSLRRRPSDKISSAILTTAQTRALTPQQLQIPQHQRRARSFSAAPTDLVHEDHERRPSSPGPSTPGTPLSIADRFMNSTAIPSSADRRASAVCSSPSPSLLSSTESQHLSTTGRERSASTLSSGRILHSPSSVSSTATPNLNRLTIASAFMRTGSTDEDKRNSSNMHPLDGLSSERPMSNGSLRLDLSLPSPVASLHGRNYTRRPWGSQDTLVQRAENKTGEDKTFGMDGYLDEQDETGSEGDEAEHEIDLNDEEKGADSNGYGRGRRNDEDEDESCPRGFWVGCCFVSYGCHRPSRRALGKAKQEGNALSLRNCGRRGWVFCTFLSLIIAIAAAYFLWPRIPLMRIEGATLTGGPNVSQTKQGAMVGNVAFESSWLVNITVDNRQNHVPTRLVGINVVAKDALTGLVIGKGLHNDDASDAFWLPANTISTIQLPINVDYQARDQSDTTFNDLCKACVPQQLPPPPPPPVNSTSNHTTAQNTTSTPPPSTPTVQRESLPLHFWITLRIWGLEYFNYQPTIIAAPANGGFACPLS